MTWWYKCQIVPASNGDDPEYLVGQNHPLGPKSVSTPPKPVPLIPSRCQTPIFNWSRLELLSSETDLNRLGANSEMVFLFNHQSAWKRVDSPLPTVVSTAIWNRAWALCGTWIGRPAQGQEGSIFWAHNHRILRTQPRVWRLWIPKPPYSRGCWTLTQETRQLLPLACSWHCQRKPRCLLSMV